MSEVVYIDRNLANDLAWGGSDDQFEFVNSEQVGTGRWESRLQLVIRRVSDQKLFGAEYALGLTEHQERCPFERDDANDDDRVEFREIEPYNVTITKYRYVE